MMNFHRSLIAFTIVVLALTIEGATYYIRAPLVLTEVVLPARTYTECGIDPVGVPVYYQGSDRSLLALRFSRPLVDTNGLPIFFLQGGQYVPVVPQSQAETNEGYNLFYRITGSSMLIESRNGILPEGFSMLHVPTTLKGITGASLGSPIEVWVTSQYVSPIGAALNATRPGSSDSGLIRLWTNALSPNRVAYCVEDATTLFSDASLLSSPLKH